MKANIFRYEFRARLQSVLTWSVSVAALILVFFGLYPSFADQAELLDQMMSKMPKELLLAFGMQDMTLSSVLGFFSFIFLFVQLCLAIQASNYGFGLVSIEETELTADFLLTRPVSRTQVLVSKLLAAGASLAITQAVAWASSFLAISLFRGGRPYETGTLVLLLASNIFFQLFFLSVGLVISLLVKRVRNVTPYALGLGFGTYVLSAFSGVFGDVALEYLTPFKHFDANAIVQQGAYDIPLLVLNVGVSVAALAASYWLYLRRDIPSVS